MSNSEKYLLVSHVLTVVCPEFLTKQCQSWFLEKISFSPKIIFQFIFQCTRKCDGGIRYRKVNCIGSKFCDLDLQPPNQEACNTHKCPTTTTTAKTTTSFKTTTSATTTTTTSPVLSSAAKMKESKSNIFDVPEFLPDINEKSSAMIEKQNIHENLMENESVMKNNNQNILTNENSENIQLEEVNLGDGKIVEIHEGGIENGKERNMDSMLSEINISGPKNLIDLRSSLNINELQNSTANKTHEKESSSVEHKINSDSNNKKSNVSNKNVTKTFTDIINNVKELGYKEHIVSSTPAKKNNDKKENFTDKFDNFENSTKKVNTKHVGLKISIKEGGNEKNTSEVITIPQVKDKDSIVDIDDQSQTGGGNHRHRHHQGFKGIGKLGNREEEKVDIKKIGPGRIPGGMGRPLPDLNDVGKLLDNIHLPYPVEVETDNKMEWTVDKWSEVCITNCFFFYVMADML